MTIAQLLSEFWPVLVSLGTFFGMFLYMRFKVLLQDEKNQEFLHRIKALELGSSTATTQMAVFETKLDNILDKIDTLVEQNNTMNVELQRLWRKGE